jgi:hypothetical protein
MFNHIEDSDSTNLDRFTCHISDMACEPVTFELAQLAQLAQACTRSTLHSPTRLHGDFREESMQTPVSHFPILQSSMWSPWSLHGVYEDSMRTP